MSRSADFRNFFLRYCPIDVSELAKEYPERKTLVIDFLDFNNFDNAAGNRLLEHPDLAIKALTDELRKYLPDNDTENLTNGQMTKAKVALKGLPDTMPFHKIEHEQTNRLIAIEGRITQIAKKCQKLTNGAFKCQRCGETNFISQPDERFMEPFECKNDACGRRKCFKIIPDDSDYEDEQKIGLQDLYEFAKPGQPLREIMVLLRGAELIESIPGMGAQCTITGIVRLQRKKESSVFEAYIEAIHIEPKETELDISISEADKQEFKKLAARDDIMQILVQSTAPEILGYESIKAALLCVTVSGADNPIFREYMHMIICGDPGTAKTLLVKFMRTVVPRAQYAAGKGSSVAGLTVALEKNELLGGGYVAKAGALVLADHGLMILDEADKLDPEDIQGLNTALEEGFIEIHKGGLNQKFSTRCSVIALCNPKTVRFDEYEPFAEQITIPGDTLSRFDLIFKILDKPNEKIDREVGQHQVNQFARYEGRRQKQTEIGILSQEKLCKYLQYAKTIKPQTNPEIEKEILEYFLTLRKPDDTGTIAANRRLINGLYRLTKALSKLRLSDKCSKEDTAIAIQIHKTSLDALKDPKTGKIDIDILYGMGHSQRDMLKQVRDIIKELQGSNGNSAHFNDIASKAQEKKINRESLITYLHHLKNSGNVFETSDGFYRVYL